MHMHIDSTRTFALNKAHLLFWITGALKVHHAGVTWERQQSFALQNITAQQQQQVGLCRDSKTGLSAGADPIYRMDRSYLRCINHAQHNRVGGPKH